MRYIASALVLLWIALPGCTIDPPEPTETPAPTETAKPSDTPVVSPTPTIAPSPSPTQSPTPMPTPVDIDQDGVSRGQDCNDQDGSIYPGAVETCDLKDNNCNSVVDEGVTTVFYFDADQDGFGNPSSALSACAAPSSGYITTAQDCNDANAAVSPSADEQCNAIDDDCDGQIDEGGTTPYYRDQDGDTYGSEIDFVLACDAPSGTVERSGDCNDFDDLIHPNAREVRGDGIDQDCEAGDLPHLDLNLDGWPDLLVVNQISYTSGVSTNSRIYWGSSRGPSASSFTDLPTLGAAAACVSDFNQDGYQDIAFANYSDDISTVTTSYLYFGSVTGFSTNQRASFPSKGAKDCAVGDVNGDGHLDLAFSGYYDGDYNSSTYLYYGSSSGPTTTGAFSVESHGNEAVHIDDLNGDGNAELLQSNYYDDPNGGEWQQDSYIYWGAKSGLSEDNRTAFPTLGCWQKAVVADLDGDGFKDLVFPSFYDNSTWDVSSFIYWGSSAGFSTTAVTSLPTPGAAQAATADLDGDGLLDLVFSSQNNSTGEKSTEASVYWGSVRGFSSNNLTTLPTNSTYELAIDDLNLDGIPDLVFSGHYDGSTYLTDSFVYMGGVDGYSTNRVFALPGNGAVAVAAFDMDLDGYSEVIVGGYRNSTVNDVDTYLYWGSSAGYSETDRVPLPSFGARQVLVVGNPD